jgi:ribosomal protein S18 acetylase RimI-like enzyme
MKADSPALIGKVNMTALSSNELAKLIEDNLSAKSQDYAKLTGGQLHTGNPAWFTSGLNRAGYNGVTCAQFCAEQLDRQITDALEPFRQNGIPLTWWVGPLSQPGTLGRALQAHGFIHNRDMIGMAADLSQLTRFTPPKLDYTFEQVNDLAGLEDWMPLFMETFGIPVSDGPFVLDVFGQLSFSPDSEWRHYALRVDNKVAATGSLHFGAGVAGLYNIATRPEYRQNGLGTAITLLIYEQALQMGYCIGTLQTTYPNALRLYHRMGFEVYCKFGIYQRGW